jgi:rRNA maturation protein Nop10
MLKTSYPVQEDKPRPIDDFRLFTLREGEPSRCSGPNHVMNPSKFQVHIAKNAITLTCEDCGEKTVVIVNEAILYT